LVEDGAGGCGGEEGGSEASGVPELAGAESGVAEASFVSELEGAESGDIEASGDSELAGAASGRVDASDAEESGELFGGRVVDESLDDAESRSRFSRGDEAGPEHPTSANTSEQIATLIFSLS
jgi:hypothetical protein